MAGTRGTYLDEIVRARKHRLREERARVPVEALERAAEARSERRDFARAISGDGTAANRGTVRVIAELKRASPSRGLLRERYRRREIARSFEAVGAAALSVLTEEQFFLGSLQDLQEVRESVRLPVLRKDFILDRYQVIQSVAAGADALLLIVAALKDNELRSLIDLSKGLRIDALVEVHTEEELDRALAAGGRIIGVNNRDLKTLEVRPEVSSRLREKIPSTCVAVSESGVKTAGDVRRLAAAGFHAVLIGERLMTAPDPGKALEELLQNVVGSRQ